VEDLMTKLVDKVAFITGSTSGMGLAIARRLAREGATVVLNSRKAPEVPLRIGPDDAEAHHIAGDVADEHRVNEMIAEIEGRYGGLDILVNNAGTTVFVDHRNLAGVTTEDWQRILSVNIVGAWNTVRAAEQMLKASKAGVVINVTSIAGIRPTGSSIPYAVSKAGLNHLTALLARSLAPDIRVNGIAPGYIDTPWTKDYVERRDEVIRDTPLHRVGVPDDVAGIALALVLSEYVTGEIVTVDGGLSLV
jgi:ketoreductase RED2